jgi:hypothetical protein
VGADWVETLYGSAGAGCGYRDGGEHRDDADREIYGGWARSLVMMLRAVELRTVVGRLEDVAWRLNGTCATTEQMNRSAIVKVYESLELTTILV